MTTTKDTMLALDMAFRGQPFVRVGSGLVGDNLDKVFRGTPITVYGDSGTTHNVTVNEAATATDTYSPTLVAVPTVTETTTASDASDNTLTTTASASEAGTAADTAASTGIVVADVSEGVLSVDTPTAALLFSVGVVEAGTANDDQDSLRVAVVEAVEVVGAGDTTDSTYVAVVVADEALTASDDSSTLAQLIAQANEDASAIDTPVATMVTWAAMMESATASTTQTATSVVVGNTTETATASDTADRGVLLAASVTETSVAADTVTSTAVRVGTVDEAGQATESFDGVGSIKTGKKTKADIKESATATTTQTAGRGSLVFQSEVLAAYEVVDATVRYALVPADVVEVAQALDSESPNVATNSDMSELGVAAVVAAASYIGLVQVGAEAVPATDQASATYSTSAHSEESATPSEYSDSTIQAVRSVAEAAAADEANDTTVDWSVAGEELAAADDSTDTTMDYVVDVLETVNADANTTESVDVVPPVYIFEAVAADDIAQASVIVNAEIEEPTDNMTQAVDYSGFLILVPFTESADAADQSDCAVDYAISMDEFTAAVDQLWSRADLVADRVEAVDPEEVSDAIRAARLFKSKFVTVQFGEATKRTVVTQLIAKRSLNFSGKVVARRVPFTDPT